MQEKREEALMKALEKRASIAGAGGSQDQAQRAFNAAKARAAMSPKSRELARRRWKNAARRVMSPAQLIKRAMGNFAKQKVDKSQTVVSRVEKLESENKENLKRIHQLEKLCKKLSAKQLKEAAAEYVMSKRLDSVETAVGNIGSGLFDLKNLTIGAGAQVAFAALEQGRVEEERRGPSAIIGLREASRREVVVAKLEVEASAEGISSDLSEKLLSLSVKLERPLAVDFVAGEVANLVEDILTNHDHELDDLHFMRMRKKVDIKKMPALRSLGSIVFTKRVLEDSEIDSGETLEDGRADRLRYECYLVYIN
jgi:hypothetical protein